MIDLPPTHLWNLPDIQYPKLSHTFHFSKVLFAPHLKCTLREQQPLIQGLIASAHVSHLA